MEAGVEVVVNRSDVLMRLGVWWDVSVLSGPEVLRSEGRMTSPVNSVRL